MWARLTEANTRIAREFNVSQFALGELPIQCW